MKFLKYLAIIVFGFWLFTYFAFPTYTHSFRVTFAVSDNGTLKTGSSVVSVSITDIRNDPLAQTSTSTDVTATSPWIDLGQRGLLVVSVKPWRSREKGYRPETTPLQFISSVAHHAFMNIDARKLANDKVKLRELANVVGQKSLGNDQLPQFVWFPDPADRTSARIVYPDEFQDVIGPNIEFVSVTVQMPATRDVDDSLLRKLPWLQVAIDKRRVSSSSNFPVVGVQNFMLNAGEN